MVFSHGEDSNVGIHVRGGAHHELIVSKADPVGNVLGESHFGIKVNTSVVPESHPPPDIGLECLWS